MQSSGRLTDGDIIHIIIEKFIGIPGGDLCGFTHRTLHGFLAYLQIPENMYQDGGTKSEKLRLAFKNSNTPMQAKILQELLARFPPDGSVSERENVRKEVELILAKLGSILPLEIPHTISASEIVNKTLQSAQTLLESFGPAHAIDRIHTALHGYLKEKCQEQDIHFNQDDQITRLYKVLREQHPSLSLPEGWESAIDLVMKSQSTVLEQLNRARNHGSFAHPNPLLPAAEACLFIDTATTLFHYLEAKFDIK